MFKPQFSLSEAFENRLTSIRETNDHLRRLTFPHKKMKELKEEALNTSICLIIQPENQRIGYGRVARIIESPFQKPTEDSEQRITTVYAVLKKIKTYTNSTKKYGEDDFIDLYCLLKGDSRIKDQIDKGKKPYRDSHIDIRESSQKKLYDAAPHGDIHLYTVDLFDWLGYESKDVHPIIKAIIAYFQVLIVRPFPADNCKMAWFLFLSTLCSHDYDFGGYISLEKDIFVSREAFHNDVLHLVSGTFHSGDFSRSDFQPYIMYLLPTIENTITERRLWIDKEHFKEVGEILKRAKLNERQKKALTHVAERGRITNREYQEMNGLHNRKLAWQELSHMVDTEILKDVDRDRGRNAGYEFGPIITSETVMKQIRNN